MKKKSICLAIIISLALLITTFSLGTSWAKDTIKWRCDTPVPEWRACVKDYMAWADRIKTRSNGKLVMTVYPGGALGFNMADVLRVLKAGTVEASMTAPFYLIRDAAPMGLLTVQGIYNERQDYLKMVDTLREVKTKIYSKWKIVHLGQSCADDSIVCLWTNKPIKTLEDMRGMKIRCWDKYQGISLRETGVGISTPTIAQADMYMAMKTGVVDGVLYPPKAGKGFGLADITKYATVLYPYADMGVDLIASKVAWDKLSPDLQEIVLEATKWWEQHAIDMYLNYEIDEAGIKYCKENNVTFTWLPEAERAKISKAAFRVWKKETEKIGASWVYERLSAALAK